MQTITSRLSQNHGAKRNHTEGSHDQKDHVPSWVVIFDNRVTTFLTMGPAQSLNDWSLVQVSRRLAIPAIRQVMPNSDTTLYDTCAHIHRRTWILAILIGIGLCEPRQKTFSTSSQMKPDLAHVGKTLCNGISKDSPPLVIHDEIHFLVETFRLL